MPLRRKPKSLAEATRYPFFVQTGPLTSAQTALLGHDMDNNSYMSYASADGLRAIEFGRVDDQDRTRIGSSIVRQTAKIVRFVMNANAGMVDQCVWIADQAYEVLGAFEIHATAGNDSGAVTLDITKESSGVAPTAGSSVLATTFNMKSTANTYQAASPATTQAAISIAAGDRISMNFTGTVTTLAGVVVELFLSPGYASEQAVFNLNANASLADQCFYIANKTMQITRIDYVHSTAGSDASAVNVQVTKDTSTNAPGAGTNLLTNNTNAGFDCKATANVVQNGTLTATAADLILVPGERLSVDFAGTTTALAGVVIVVTMQPYYRSFDFSWNIAANGSLADQSTFIANRALRVLYVSEVHSTAGTDGSAVNLQLTLDRSTDAPGAGSNLLSNNTSAGFDLKGTANTVQPGTFVSEGLTYLLPGDRLSVDFAGVLTSLAGVVVTVTLTEA